MRSGVGGAHGMIFVQVKVPEQTKLLELWPGRRAVHARFVEKRVKGVKITPYCGKIQDKDEDYYMQFGMVICGLDSIEARRWINAMLVGMVDGDNPDSLKPLIDGGTEGKNRDRFE